MCFAQDIIYQSGGILFSALKRIGRTMYTELYRCIVKEDALPTHRLCRCIVSLLGHFMVHVKASFTIPLCLSSSKLPASKLSSCHGPSQPNSVKLMFCTLHLRPCLLSSKLVLWIPQLKFITFSNKQRT